MSRICELCGMEYESNRYGVLCDECEDNVFSELIENIEQNLESDN